MGTPRAFLRLPAEPTAAAAARHVVGEVVQLVDERARWDAQLLVSELVTNSIRHAGSDDIEVSVEAKPEAVRCVVRDHGKGLPDPLPVERSRDDGGWGLYIVSQIADRWGVEKNEGACVWFEIRL